MVQEGIYETSTSINQGVLRCYTWTSVGGIHTDSSAAVLSVSLRGHVDVLRVSVENEVGDSGASYMWSSRQIFGPTTLAAPLAILKEKWPAGQALESPHLYLDGTVAVEDKVTGSHSCLPNNWSLSLF